jgi:hypothetical protein
MAFNPYRTPTWTAEKLLAEWARLEAEWRSGADISQVSAGDVSVSRQQRISQERLMEMVGEALYAIDPFEYACYLQRRRDRTIFAQP